MKKSFLLLPLSALILTACSSTPPAPVVNADGSDLSPGVMQPVAGTGAMDNSYGWQSEVQTTSMPSTMTIPTPIPVPQPISQSAPVPTYEAPQPVTTPAPKPVSKPSPAKMVKKPVSQDFTIPRDENNAPIYSQIDKGFYNGDSYTVRKGDTMFLIAYIAGKDVNEIARLNNMSEPYQLRVGQTLKLSNGSSNQQTTVATTKPTPAPAPQPVEPEVTYTQGANGTAYGSDGTVTGPVKAGTGSTPPSRTAVIASTGTGVTASVGSTSPSSPRITATTAESPRSSSMNAAPAVSAIKWQWPTQGRIIQGFSSAEGGNKGIDIAGNKGQPVKAAAAGRVVYAGNALQGYGNLIIIKHSDDFLSAYAHNDSIKVDEQDNVKAGETIGTLGSTGTNSNKLHFEIRYQGKSVDPTRYLPRQ